MSKPAKIVEGVTCLLSRFDALKVDIFTELSKDIGKIDMMKVFQQTALIFVAYNDLKRLGKRSDVTFIG